MRHATTAHGLAGATACVLALALTSAFGCISREKRDLDAAHKALAACEAEHGLDHPECEQARLRVRDSQERYEEAGRRAWSCDPTQDPCPTPR